MSHALMLDIRQNHATRIPMMSRLNSPRSASLTWQSTLTVKPLPIAQEP